MNDAKRAGLFRPALFFHAATAIVCAAACYSSNYRKELGASTDLISELSDKLAQQVMRGLYIRGMTGETPVLLLFLQ